MQPEQIRATTVEQEKNALIQNLTTTLSKDSGKGKSKDKRTGPNEVDRRESNPERQVVQC